MYTTKNTQKAPVSGTLFQIPGLWTKSSVPVVNTFRQHQMAPATELPSMQFLTFYSLFTDAA